VKVLLGSVLITALLAPAPHGQSSAHDSLQRTALRVMELETRRQMAGATPATIDSLLALYSDSIVYDHPGAGAVVRGKDALRRGMLQYIGTVRSVHADPPRVTVARDVVVVETNARIEIKDDGKWTPVTRHGLRVIEFDRAGRVRRLIDYPW
jgi:SnoaL-like protein